MADYPEVNFYFFLLMDNKINKELVFIFNDMSLIYRFLGATQRFRAIAYQQAARAIDSLQQDVTYYINKDTLESIPGIGESIALKIKEYISTGKIEKYEQLKKTIPYGIINLMNIRGFGPQSLHKLHSVLKINTRDELITALQDGRVSKVKGFGTRKIENMLKGLNLHKVVEDRALLWRALEVGEKIITWLKQLPEVKQVELAGSLRRKKETIGDIDILVSCERRHREKIITHFTGSDMASEILAKGDTKASIILKELNRQADLRIVNEDEWGSALQYFTGSKEHNIHLRTIARDKGYKISEYGIFQIKNNKKLAGKSEAEIYNILGFQLIPPEMRENRGEIELAGKHKLPDIVSVDNILGDLQMHSTWSDGICSIEEIAAYVKKYFHYKYIVITDHSKSSRIAKGLDEHQLLKQLKEIERINKKLDENFIKTGIEVDILSDGSLDLSDEILSRLDWVTASIHSNFNRDNTNRIIRACENPFVNCIGHPTGRLIGSREPYKININEVIDIAKATGTYLEINSQPDRMDLNDELARLAKDKGVKLVISTDSHSLKQLHYMKLGVFIARRAWCTAGDILNTRKWDDISLAVLNKRKKQAKALPVMLK